MTDIIITELLGQPAPHMGCVMQHVCRSLGRDLSEGWAHPCLNPVVVQVSVFVNDHVSLAHKQRLIPLIPRIAAARGCNDVETERRINARLQQWRNESPWTEEDLVEGLEKLLDQWEKIAADEGALANLKEPD